LTHAVYYLLLHFVQGRLEHLALLVVLVEMNCLLVQLGHVLPVAPVNPVLLAYLEGLGILPVR